MVFDEAHNIGIFFFEKRLNYNLVNIHWSYTLILLDNVCIESLSIDLTKPNLDASARSIAKLSEKIDE